MGLGECLSYVSPNPRQGLVLFNVSRTLRVFELFFVSGFDENSDDYVDGSADDDDDYMLIMALMVLLRLQLLLSIL